MILGNSLGPKATKHTKQITKSPHTEKPRGVPWDSANASLGNRPWKFKMSGGTHRSQPQDVHPLSCIAVIYDRRRWMQWIFPMQSMAPTVMLLSGSRVDPCFYHLCCGSPPSPRSRFARFTCVSHSFTQGKPFLLEEGGGGSICIYIYAKICMSQPGRSQNGRHSNNHKPQNKRATKQHNAL